jgi:uncharacterized protein (TIGR02466 family)
MEIFDTFYCPVLVNKSSPSEQTVFGMKEIIKYEENEYLESDSNTSYVGDKVCFDKLHTFKEFDWLNNEVNKMLLEFIDVYGIESDKCNFYVQKCWPVILKNGDVGLFPHSHPNSHISFVYYLQTEPDNKTGQLYFKRRLDWWDGTVPFEEGTISIPAITNNCLMFPSSLRHWVDDYYGETPRISITYDITITSKNIPGLVNREMMFSDPVFWRKLNGKTLST